MHITIPGQTPAQKNNKAIVGIRMIKPKLWSGTPTITDNTRVKTWRKDTAKHLSETYTERMSGQVIAIYKFYVKDKRGRDIDNMVVSANDAMVAAGIIPGDTWQVLQSGGFSAELDKENPRAEIELYNDEWKID
jgi:Holliday junction resolvase RusA-like endonuclease